MNIPAVTPSFLRSGGAAQGSAPAKTLAAARSAGPAVVVSLSAEARARLESGPWGSVQPAGVGPWGDSQPATIGPIGFLPSER
jgi:hypothetical protein